MLQYPRAPGSWPVEPEGFREPEGTHNNSSSDTRENRDLEWVVLLPVVEKGLEAEPPNPLASAHLFLD